MADAPPVRVWLVGVSAADVERLRRAVAPGAEIVGTILLDGRSGTSNEVPSVDDGEAVLMSSEALRRLQRLRERRPSEPPPAEALTARERDVLAFVAEGHGNREIGQLLGISEHTVKFHLASIYGKLGVGNRTEAVQHALRMGLIDI